MVALEAIACGCPIVVIDRVPEIVRRFPTVPTYDADQLRRTIDALLDGQPQPIDTDRMTEYHWASVAHRYIGLYQSALRHPA